MSVYEQEVKKGERFEFGKNWLSYISLLDDERIKIAKESIQDMLGVDVLDGKRVLDIGSGSGVFSLAARKLGATVRSFDYEPASVNCAKELRSRFFANDSKWMIEEGSILDRDYVQSLGRFDIVYSWGVLHHTGDMWTAVENAASLVNEKGTILIAIYNDQGIKSRLWKFIKKLYCSGVIGKTMTSCIFFPYFFLTTLISSIYKRENQFTKYKNYHRGMSITHDWFDWLGGFPYEVANVEEIFNFFQARGFILKKIKTTYGLGNNQFVFEREIIN